jgi:hypothetical protein
MIRPLGPEVCSSYLFPRKIIPQGLKATKMTTFRPGINPRPTLKPSFSVAYKAVERQTIYGTAEAVPFVRQSLRDVLGSVKASCAVRKGSVVTRRETADPSAPLRFGRDDKGESEVSSGNWFRVPGPKRETPRHAGALFAASLRPLNTP